MQYETIFDRLVMDLSSRERKELLDKIQNSQNVSVEPLGLETDDEREISLEQAYAKLGLLRKVLIFFISLFTGKKRETVIEEHLLSRLSARISRKNPSLINFQRKLLLDGFIKEIEKLQMHLTPLTTTFTRALEKQRGAFHAFLVSLELPQINERLVEETDPGGFYIEDRFRDISEVRGEMEHRFKRIIDGIDQESRSRIYHSTLALNQIHRFATFRFEEIVPAGSARNAGKRVLNFSIVKRELLQLADLLKSTAYPPPSNALKAVFLFAAQQSMVDGFEDTEVQIDDFIKTMDTALGNIRQFNQTVPLVDIIRCMSRNYAYTPQTVRGGEDWFALFRTYWEQKIDDRYKEFYREKKVGTLAESALSFLDAEAFLELSHYRQTGDGSSRYIKFPLTITFIKNFIERLFITKMSKPLKVLLLNGNFYKKQNRSEFTDAYNTISNLSDRISLLDSELSPTGEIGAKIQQVEYEIKQNKLRHKQIASIAKECDDHAKLIIEESIVNLSLLASVIDGVLHGQIGGKYDTISNLKNLGGKENSEFLNSLGATVGLLSKASDFTRDFYIIESRTRGKDKA